VSEEFPVEEVTVEGIHAALRAGELTCRGLVGAYLRRIETYDRAGPRLNAILTVNPAAGDRAGELDAELARTGELAGPLHGVPILVKDCIETAGITTTFGSVAVGDYRPRHDATVVRKLHEAGAIVLAKTTLADFTASWFSYSSRSGDTRNPYDLDRDAGGSSAGSAAGVAANLGAVALGTDCGGSIRVPASFNSLVGVRTTPGLVSRAGCSVLVALQDTVGPLARTVADAAAVLDVLVGYDPADPYTSEYAIAGSPRSYRAQLAPDALEGARVGVVRNAFGPDDDPEASAVNAVVDQAVAAMRRAGASLVDVVIPRLHEEIEGTSMYRARTKHDIDAFLAARPELPVRSMREIHARGLYDERVDLIDAVVEGPDDPERDVDYLRRFAARARFTRTVVNLMAAEGLAALAYPSVQVLPPRRVGSRWTTLTFPTNTVIASQAWMPAVSLPAGFTAAGVPVGLELTAKPYDEATLLRLAYAFEQATQHRRPPELSRAPA